MRPSEEAATGTDRLFIPYEIPLADGGRARMRLPEDLTEEEAERLCEIIRSLAFPEGGSPGSREEAEA